MANAAVWHGTDEELAELEKAVQHHCECGSEWGMARVACPPHAMLEQDQAALDGLLRARRISAHLIAKEMAGAAPPKSQRRR